MKFLSCLGIGAIALAFLGCQKEEVNEVDLLPAATRNGTKAFGCLLNGKAFLPSGNDGNIGGGPYSVVYDAGYLQGSITISAFRYTRKGDPSSYQSILLFADSVQGSGRFPLLAEWEELVAFNDAQNPQCRFYPRDPHYQSGELVLTRVDKAAGIVSGTFHFKLYQPGCDSVIVTEGRFDKKL